jgi:hypothetical protein
MRARGRARVDPAGGDFADSPYSCFHCSRAIDPTTTTLESGVVRGGCIGCGRTVDFADRSASAELAERWAIGPVERPVPTLQREGAGPAEATVSEDCC